MSCSIQLKYLCFFCQYIKFVYFRFSVLFRFQSNKVQVFATSMNIYTPLYLLLKCTGIFLFTVVIISLILLPILITYGRLYYSRLKNKYKTNKDVLNVGFFHPYCNAGGGGERVLWCAIDCLLSKYPNIKIFVYTGDVDVSPKDILRRTHERFNIKLPDSIEFIYLHNRRWVEAEKYPRFTLLGQSFGSIVLGIEALNALVPDIFIDTMGYSFTLPIFYFIAKCRVACYVHYPTITTDMINRVRSRQVAHNNQNVVARNPLLTLLKLIYYNFFAFLYASVGKFTHVIMVNSSWTEDHINSLWKCPLRTYRIYPPCDSIDLQKIPIKQNIDGKIKIISVAQFRPEKNHPLQLQSLYKLRQIIPESIWENVELVMIGSTRDAKDELLVNDMQNLCKYLSLENNVTFKINISYDELKKELEDGMIGIHTMWNEHFGIGIVECMAAGLITIANNSGGPKLDIIEESDVSRTGFLASTESDYAKAIAVVISMPDRLRIKIRKAARSSINRFSVDEFKSNFLRAVEPLFVVKKDT